MPRPPYAGPEIKTSLQVINELLQGLPQPIMLLGGWGVYFTVQELWNRTFGEEYFGSRDIDLGFHAPPEATLQELRKGNLPATVSFLEGRGFTRQGAYQFLRFHDWETNEVVPAPQAAKRDTHTLYQIAVDLILDHEREDARGIANFQAFAEPLLAPAFQSEFNRRTNMLEGVPVLVPAPHLLIAMKLTSLPERQKDDKSVKDLCDLYALSIASGEDIRSVRSRLHRVKSDAASAVGAAMDSTFLSQACDHLEQSPEVVRPALKRLA